MEQKYVLNKFNTRTEYDVKETTDILSVFGLAHNERKTREIISKGRLKGEFSGKNPNDRRSGYVVTEKALYDFVVGEIPIMKEIFEHFKENKPKKTPKTKQTPKKNEIEGS